MAIARPAKAARLGAAVVEFAFLLPLIVFLLVVCVDYARIFYYSLTVTNCARNGAVWGCDPTVATYSTYTSVSQAALADASNLTPTPTVTSQTVTVGSDSYIEVTVNYTFNTITRYPLVPSSVDISRTVRMRMEKTVPNF
jgi:Flp pilus assembly protein TadG